MEFEKYKEYTDNFYEVILNFFKENNIENGALFKSLLIANMIYYIPSNNTTTKLNSSLATELMGALFLENEERIAYRVMTATGIDSTNNPKIISLNGEMVIPYIMSDIEKITKYYNSKQLKINTKVPFINTSISREIIIYGI